MHARTMLPPCRSSLSTTANGFVGAGLRSTRFAHSSNFLHRPTSPASTACRSTSAKRCESTSGREQQSHSKTLRTASAARHPCIVRDAHSFMSPSKRVYSSSRSCFSAVLPRYVCSYLATSSGVTCCGRQAHCGHALPAAAAPWHRQSGSSRRARQTARWRWSPVDNASESQEHRHSPAGAHLDARLVVQLPTRTWWRWVEAEPAEGRPARAHRFSVSPSTAYTRCRAWNLSAALWRCSERGTETRAEQGANRVARILVGVQLQRKAVVRLRKNITSQRVAPGGSSVLTFFISPCVALAVRPRTSYRLFFMPLRQQRQEEERKDA